MVENSKIIQNTLLSRKTETKEQMGAGGNARI
jgi:hypothetical protein